MMKANQTAGVLLAGAMTTIAAADLLIPIEQERYVEVTSACHDNITGQSDFVADHVGAPAFGIFNEALSVSAACGGLGEADQFSQIGGDSILGNGSTYAGGFYSVNYGWGGGYGLSYCSVTFDVADWTYMVLTGNLAAETAEGSAAASFSLSDSVQVVAEGEVVFNPGPGGGALPVDERLWLEEGTYTLLFQAACSDYGGSGGGSSSSADFDFQVQLALEEPCAADCFPVGGDGVVDVLDLIFVLAEWGSTNSPADIAPGPGDGIVNVHDLLLVLGQWGPCPP